MKRLLNEEDIIKIIDKYYDADECNGSDVAMDIMADISVLSSAQLDRGYVEQIKWERDLAIQQLKDLGYGLGEKPRTNGDTISRQALMESLKISNTDCEKCESSDPNYGSCMRDFVEACAAIIDAPTIEERKKGKWVKKRNSDLLYCSECNLPSMHNWPYCERCGADMRGEQDG